MAFSVPNASAATQTHLRTQRNFSRLSGMCATCLDGCPGYCEVGTSSYRASEAIYPQPFGNVTAGAEKDYPVDYSSFNINGTAVGAIGISSDSDLAIFPSVNLEVGLGHDGGIKLGLPFTIPGLGSTDIAAKNWDGLASGAALTGTLLTIGENVCGMDDEAEFSKDSIPQVLQSPALRHRIRTYRDWQEEGHGGIVLQENVEDSRLGVMRYGLGELGCTIAELKWGQGAKNIGGEVKLHTLARAQRLKRRGYIVLPDPDNSGVQEAYDRGAIKEFERHSRIGMVTEEGFMSRVQELRALGAKHVMLKTGAYRPADLARAIKYSSSAKVDVLTLDAAGGGTGMSPWRMMNEWGLPPVEMITLAKQYMDRLAQRGEYVPDLVVAGGFAFEDQIFKGLALGAPYVKAVGMARAPICAAHVAKNIAKGIEAGELDKLHSQYGSRLDSIFVMYHELKHKLGPRLEELPAGGLGVYHYYMRLAQGLRQLMCGARKFALEHINSDDIFALTREAADLTGIRYVMDVDADEVDKILG